jgi:hypothetical protein
MYIGPLRGTVRRSTGEDKECEFASVSMWRFSRSVHTCELTHRVSVSDDGDRSWDPLLPAPDKAEPFRAAA